MSNQFTERMKRVTNSELEKMLEKESKYFPEVIDAVKEELDSRKNGISHYIDINKLERERIRALSSSMPRAKPSFR